MDGPAIQGQNAGVCVGVELKVRDDVWEVGDRDISAEGGRGGDSYEAGSGAELEDIERAAMANEGGR